jgi:hypothetical protein
MAFLLSILLNFSFAQSVCQVSGKKEGNVDHLGQIGGYIDEVWFWQFGGDERYVKRDAILKALQDDGRLNNREVEVLKRRDVRVFPEDMLAIKDAACEAFTLSMAICGRATKEAIADNPSYQNEETDAVRHLLLSSLLRSKRGNDFTRDFLTAHEMIPYGPIWDENSPKWQQPKFTTQAMDLHNNKIGRSMKAFPKSGPPINSISRDVVRELTKSPRKIRVNRTGDSRCADPKAMKELDWRQVFRDMKQVKEISGLPSCRPLSEYLK